MNLSRRSLLTSLIAAPAVIAADRLMPVRLFIPTIYGDAVHDDYEGLLAWMKGEKVYILPRGFSHNDDMFNMGEGVFRISKGLHIPENKSLIGANPHQTTLIANASAPYTIGVNEPCHIENLAAYSLNPKGFGIKVF